MHDTDVRDAWTNAIRLVEYGYDGESPPLSWHGGIRCVVVVGLLVAPVTTQEPAPSATRAARPSPTKAPVRTGRAW